MPGTVTRPLSVKRISGMTDSGTFVGEQTGDRQIDFDDNLASLNHDDSALVFSISASARCMSSSLVPATAPFLSPKF